MICVENCRYYRRVGLKIRKKYRETVHVVKKQTKYVKLVLRKLEFSLEIF